MRNRGSLRAVRYALLCGAAWMLACGSGEEPAPAGQPTPPPAAEPAAPQPPAPEPAAPAAEPAAPAAPSDAQPTAADPEQGAVLYAQYCAACHGERGAGDGPAGMALDPRPVSHADGTYMNNLSNEHLFTVIKNGGPAVGKSPLMAPWGGSLTDEQIGHVVAFVRSLAKPAYTGPMP